MTAGVAYLDENNQPVITNHPGLSSWIDNVVSTVKTTVQSGIQTADASASSLLSGAAQEVKAHIKEAMVAYGKDHPNEVRIGTAGLVVIVCGSVAGLLVMGNIISKRG